MPDEENQGYLIAEYDILRELFRLSVTLHSRHTQVVSKRAWLQTMALTWNVDLEPAARDAALVLRVFPVAAVDGLPAADLPTRPMPVPAF